MIALIKLGWRTSVLNLVVDVGIDAEYRTAVDENLCKEIEDGIVNLAWRWEEESNESHHDTREEEHDCRPFLKRKFTFHSDTLPPPGNEPTYQVPSSRTSPYRVS